MRGVTKRRVGIMRRLTKKIVTDSHESVLLE